MIVMTNITKIGFHVHLKRLVILLFVNMTCLEFLKNPLHRDKFFSNIVYEWSLRGKYHKTQNKVKKEKIQNSAKMT